MVVESLVSQGYDAERLVPEEGDITLGERARRVNAWCSKLGRDNVILISIHNNAAGDGSAWMKGTGWEIWTSRGETKADALARCIYEAALETIPGIRVRKESGEPDKEKDFYILAKTQCPAVLTENFFQDNEEEVKFLESQDGKEKIARLHVEGIKKYIKG